MDTFFIFLGIILLFFIMLAIKSFVKKEFCAICVAVSLTWLSLLVLHLLGKFDNLVLIALLMGQSILGVFYLVEKKTSDEMKLFRLPFLLSLIFAGYSVLSNTLVFSVIKLLAVLWVFFLAIFLYRKNPAMKTLVDKIIACCKWE